MTGVRAFFTRTLDGFSDDLPLRYKLIVTFSLFMLFPVLFIGVGSYTVSRAYLEESEESALLQSMKQLNTTIDFFYELFMERTEMLYDSKELQELLARENRDLVEQVSAFRQLENMVANQFADETKYEGMTDATHSGGKLAATVFAANRTLPSDGQTLLPLDDVWDTAWCRALYEQNALFSWDTSR